MSSSDSETELKKRKEKKHKDKGKHSGDERKERRDREKEERKERRDKGKEERDKEKEERKERKDKEKEEKKDKRKHEDKKDKLSHPSGSGVNVSGRPPDVHDGKAASHHQPGTPFQPLQSHSQLAHPSKPEDVPWFLREPDAEPAHGQPPQTAPDFPIQTPSPQYSSHPPPRQQPFGVVGDVGGVPPVQNIPPSGYRIPLGPNAQFPAPGQLGRPPATDVDGSTPVFIGSAILANSVHPCKIVPSLHPPCRVLYGGSEIEHHGRYDLLPVTQDLEWIPTKNGEIPPGRRPVDGGYESNGSKLYHALGFAQGVYVPGKAGQHLRGAVIPVGGSEHHLQENYSILCWK